MSNSALRHRQVRLTSDRPITLHVVEAGAADAPLLVLLHGFPDNWRCWEAELKVFAKDYLVVAPDQRGYGGSDKPRGLAAYQLDFLAGDIAALIRSYGRDKAALVGHDWGAAVAWHTTLTQPTCVERLAVLNVPHPRVFQNFLNKDPEQRKRSRYMLWFQPPILPELMLRRKDCAWLERGLRNGSMPGTFSPAQIAQAKAEWKVPGTLTPMLNWYRAALRKPSALPEDRKVHVPTRIIWGAKDPFLRHEMAQASLAYCDQGEVTVLPAASHWSHKDQPAEVQAVLRDWLR